MKKLMYWIGAFVSLAAIFATVAVLLKKLKISLSIEGIDDTLDESNDSDIDVSIEGENSKNADGKNEEDFSETEEAVKDFLDGMLDDDAEKEVEVEITKEE